MGGTGSGRKTVRTEAWKAIELCEAVIRRVRQGEMTQEEMNDYLDDQRENLYGIEKDLQSAIDKERKKNG